MGGSLLQILYGLPEYRRLEQTVMEEKGPVAVYGLQEANKAHVIATAAQKVPVLYICATDLSAAELWEQTKSLVPYASLLLPRDVPLVHVMNTSNERAVQRVGTIMSAVSEDRPVILCSVAALMQKLAPAAVFREHCTTVRTGDELDPRALLAKLCGSGYERVEMVDSRGQVAARGDILDVYPPQERYPIRIEFWGDTVDQMRSFDPVTQISVEQRMEMRIPPAFETPQTKEAVARALSLCENNQGFEPQRDAWEHGTACESADALLTLLYENLETFLEYLPSDTVIFADEPARIEEAAKTSELTFHETVMAMLERGEGNPLQAELIMGAEEMLDRISTVRTAALYAFFRSHPGFVPRETVQFTVRPVPKYLGDMTELANDLQRWRETGESVALYAGEQAQALAAQLEENGACVLFREQEEQVSDTGKAEVFPAELLAGFSYPALKLTVLGASELYGKKSIGERKAGRRKALSFSELKPGDYIVHETHGIGRFVGIEPLTTDGKTRDYLLLEYRGGDRLYIPTENMDRVQKYISGKDEDIVPQLSKLGGNDWQKRVGRARDAAKKLAVDLAALYAARAQIKGFAFSGDSAWQIQLEERFPYTETQDQIQSIREIKQDMERPKPMDRLLCGDVGYGKTEVAIRAAFKAVQDSKQVAVLVPTTILAQQHFNTFAERFSDFPVRIACMSRFRTRKELDETKRKLRSGEIDIVIGTHALLAKDVAFKDLGLLIIDEEHRFGVNHKEKIKEMRQQIDVLTLSATPIPRTLNLSMTGIRDISVLETPPEGRYPVQTVVLEYTDALVADAITKEIGRGGQVYVVSNRVQGFEGIEAHLRELVPEATVLAAHGQMDERVLEQTMYDFMEHKADILLCSTIIESGLDIPNANTMIVLDADRFGLAQLYQLRGRIGRSTRLGYAYLTVQRGRGLSEKAQKRLTAIREFTQFGAGFQLAMRDLEIRGAGSLLGAEQHGHIADIGYEYYLKIIRNAVQEAKGEAAEREQDVAVDIVLNAHIPKDYVFSEVQRLELYRRIADVRDKEQELRLKEELEDRFGDIPESVENLFRVAVIKNLAARAGLARVSAKDGEARMIFTEDAQLDGEKLIGAVSQMPGARIMASSPPGIVLSVPKMSLEEIVPRLPQFLYMICHCVTAF